MDFQNRELQQLHTDCHSTFIKPLVLSFSYLIPRFQGAKGRVNSASLVKSLSRSLQVTKEALACLLLAS